MDMQPVIERLTTMLSPLVEKIDGCSFVVECSDSGDNILVTAKKTYYENTYETNLYFDSNHAKELHPELDEFDRAVQYLYDGLTNDDFEFTMPIDKVAIWEHTLGKDVDDLSKYASILYELQMVTGVFFESVEDVHTVYIALKNHFFKE